MKRIRFGTPEEFVPSKFCKNFNYVETDVKYDVSKIRGKANARGYTLILPYKGEPECIYGFGLQFRQFNFRLSQLTLRTAADPIAPTGDTHAPVPFFISRDGYGIFIDTARNVEYQIGVKLSGVEINDRKATVAGPAGEDTIAIQIPVAKGVDVYIIEGDTITDIVAQYNMLAGGGPEVPDWGLGVFYRCHAGYDEEKVKAMADYMRDKDIPCTILGLEPGWHTHSYSCSYVWNKEKFPDPDRLNKYLEERGFHVNLWEHAFVHPTAPFYNEIAEYSSNYDVWDGHVPDFSLPEARKIFADYHKENIIKGCIDGFKLDECDSGIHTGAWSFPEMADFPSGMDGELYHNLFGTLYAKTMLEALDGKPTLSEIRQAGALYASYPFVLYSDLYNHEDFIRAVVSSGFVGLLWTSEVRHADSKEDLLRRLQTTVFSPQCLINAWYCEEAPWVKWECEKEAIEILKIRERLIPMLKEAFETYHKTGIPPVRALVCDYTDDINVVDIDNQYIFCKNLVVCPMFAGKPERKVYLPEGDWVDFYTGEKVESGTFKVSSENIPVYVNRARA